MGTALQSAQGLKALPTCDVWWPVSRQGGQKTEPSGDAGSLVCALTDAEEEGAARIFLVFLKQGKDSNILGWSALQGGSGGGKQRVCGGVTQLHACKCQLYRELVGRRG